MFILTQVNGVVNLEMEFNENKTYSIELLNSVGQRMMNVANGNAQSVREQMDLSDLPRGLYFLSMEIDGQIYNHKISIK